MPPIEQQLQQRYPHWFRGRRAVVARPLLRSMTRWSRLDTVQAFLERQRDARGLAFVSAALEFLQAGCEVDAQALGRIPARGGVLVVANHPSGALDALALLEVVGRVRGDVCIVANDLLCAIEPLAELLLPVRILGGRPSPTSLRAVEAALAAGRCVIVFPAGEVSRLSLRGVRDSRWRRGFVRFARGADVPVLPIRVEARNSALFYGASALFKPMGTALLAREMFARRGRTVRLCIGEALCLEADSDADAQARRVRRALYALGGRVAPRTAGPEPLPAAEDPLRVEAELEEAELLGAAADGRQIRLARCRADSVLLRELGRLRERTFRTVGEGTGRARDIDDFDLHYQHIVVWDARERRIAGAYRIRRGACALAQQGLAGLYTASLFRYADAAIPRLAEGLELGRSFVVPEDWGGRSLDYLWQGIGAYLQRHPGVRYLFGAVSMSAALPRGAREQLVAYYQRYHGDADRLAMSNRPFAFVAAPPGFGDMDAATAFGVLKANLAALGAQVPVLYKQYTELCEPGGARFLAFGIDPDFSGSIDGLVEVDLHRIRPNKRRRYLRDEGAVA